MKTILLTLLGYLVHFGSVVADEKTTGSAQSTTLSRVYQFESFTPGRVRFRDGTFTNASMNYNYLHGAIQFLNAHGDTLLLTNKERIDYIEIGEEVFYSQQPDGEVQFVGNYGQLFLAQKTYLVQKGSKASASEQKYLAESGATTPSALLINNQSGEFQWQNNTVRPDYILTTHYYLIDQNRRYHPADKATFLKIFGREKAALSKHLRQHPVNFNDEEQLRNLLLFCSNL